MPEKTLMAQAAWLADHLSNQEGLGAYQPIRSERDPGPLLGALSLTGPIAFPKVPGPINPLYFTLPRGRRILPLARLVFWNLWKPCPRFTRRSFWCPWLGLMHAGIALAMGGFYDRTLAALRAHQTITAVGFACGAQLSQHALNFEETDLALDYVMTPEVLFDFRISGCFSILGSLFMSLRIGVFGDVVGRAGRDAVAAHLPQVRQQLDLDCVVLNIENAASGFGFNQEMVTAFEAQGVDVMITGNHAFDRKDAPSLLSEHPRLVRLPIILKKRRARA